MAFSDTDFIINIKAPLGVGALLLIALHFHLARLTRSWLKREDNLKGLG